MLLRPGAVHVPWPRSATFLFFGSSNPTLWAGVASGLLLALALLPRGSGPLSFVALVPLLAALDALPPPRAALGGGFACGLVLFLAGYAWVPFVGGGTLGLLLAYLVFCPLLALPVSGFALAAVWLRRFGRKTFLVAVPGLWVTTEFARHASEFGNQFLLGYSLADHPAWIQLAGLGGVYLVSLWVAAVNAALLGAAAAPRRAWRALAAVALLPWAFGAASWPRVPQAPPGQRIRVAGIQPDVPADERHVPAHFDEHLRALLQLSERSLGDRPDLIVWPESAFEPLSPAAGAPFLGAVAHHLGTPLLSGVWRVGPGQPASLRNSSVLATPEGKVVVAADKVNPIWGYESAPSSSLSRQLAHAGVWMGRFSGGRLAEVLLIPRAPAPIRAGVLVCVDATYPELARDLRRRGAELLVTIANEADSDRLTGGLQARIARLRAVESRVPLVRVSNTGPSEWVDAHGRVIASIEPGVPSTGSAGLELGEEAPPYTRVGDTPTCVLAMTTPAILAALGLARRRAPRGGGSVSLTFTKEKRG